MKKNNKLIFISGTGRSGTHLIGRSIASHTEIEGRIEDPSTFFLLTKLATTQDINGFFSNLLLKLRILLKFKQLIRKSNKHVLEKSHPSLWLVDFFIKRFKNVYFIFVYRDVEPTVSSMLEHKGVLSWYNKLPQNKINRFLGINSSNVNNFKSYQIEEKCALRWLSHKNEIIRLKEKYPDKIMTIKYDDFLIEADSYLSKTASFLGISDTFNPEEFKIDSLDKWKRKLSREQIQLIHNIIE